MRVLLGWLLLFGLAAFAGWGTARWRAQARERGDSMTRVQDTEAFGVPARVLIGAPSGADPVSQLEGSGSAPLRELDPTAPELWGDPSPPQPATFELKVHPGSTLSKICQDFYPEPRPPLSQVVEAVARWNGLVSPNDLRAGQRLQLPTIRQLFP